MGNLERGPTLSTDAHDLQSLPATGPLFLSMEVFLGLPAPIEGIPCAVGECGKHA